MFFINSNNVPFLIQEKLRELEAVLPNTTNYVLWYCCANAETYGICFASSYLWGISLKELRPFLTHFHISENDINRYIQLQTHYKAFVLFEMEYDKVTNNFNSVKFSLANMCGTPSNVEFARDKIQNRINIYTPYINTLFAALIREEFLDLYDYQTTFKIKLPQRNTFLFPLKDWRHIKEGIFTQEVKNYLEANFNNLFKLSGRYVGIEFYLEDFSLYKIQFLIDNEFSGIKREEVNLNEFNFFSDFTADFKFYYLNLFADGSTSKTAVMV